MGKRRQNRKQNASHVNSEILINDGYVSSGSESENSVVDEKCSRTSTVEGTAIAQRNANFTNDQSTSSENAAVRYESGIILDHSCDDAREMDLSKQAMIGQNIQPGRTLQPQYETGAQASSDDRELSSIGEVTKIGTTLQIV